VPIEKSEYLDRAKKVQKKMDEAGYDSFIAFSTPNVRYLTNYFPLAGSSLLFSEIKHEPVLLIDQDWDLARAKECSPLSTITATDNLAKGLEELLKKGPKQRKIGVFDWQNLPTSIYLTLKKTFPEADILDATNIIGNLRMIKSESEIRCLERAAEITSEGATAASEAIAVGITELELATVADIAMKKAGADPSELASYPVIGSGLRTVLNVPLPTEKKIEDGDLILMDLGGRYDGYCGDITRARICGRPTKEQQDVFDVVYRMNRETIKSIKPGMKCSEVHTFSNNIAIEAGYGNYLQHMTGHQIGLAIHEEPLLLNDDAPLVPSMVHTIEPGLYVPGVGGIRVEDDVLETETGPKVLTTTSRDL
jgi:Xaa-Pro aminopeptidase